jgi:hypothetical protein
VPSRAADDADGADARANFPFGQLGERTGSLIGLRPGNRLIARHPLLLVHGCLDQARSMKIPRPHLGAESFTRDANQREQDDTRDRPRVRHQRCLGRAVASPKFRVSRQAARASAVAIFYSHQPLPRCTGKKGRPALDHYKLYIRLAAASARVHPTRFPCLS